jgi:hypothetical protein
MELTAWVENKSAVYHIPFHNVLAGFGFFSSIVLMVIPIFVIRTYTDLLYILPHLLFTFVLGLYIVCGSLISSRAYRILAKTVLALALVVSTVFVTLLGDKRGYTFTLGVIFPISFVNTLLYNIFNPP